MGLDISARLILGVKLEKKEEKLKRVKYNSDTGEPYEESYNEEFFTFEGTDIKIHKSNEEYWYNEDKYEDYFFECGYENSKTFFLALDVCETTSHRIDNELYSEVPELNEDDLDKFKHFLTSLNFTEKLEYYLLQELSY